MRAPLPPSSPLFVDGGQPILTRRSGFISGRLCIFLLPKAVFKLSSPGCSTNPIAFAQVYVLRWVALPLGLEPLDLLEGALRA
ncbi:hypothetical protein NL676_012496 [Syzygium grande]|nr:hypothetical protein NL676_012496 [Syzygium grande]